MANTRSALKAQRVAERRRARNRSARSAVRTSVKKARIGILGGAKDEASAAVAEAAKELDKVASKGIIHKNQAARRKSRLMRQLARLAGRPAEPAAVQPAARRPRRTTASTRSTRSRAPIAEAAVAEKAGHEEPPAATTVRATRRTRSAPKAEDST